MRLEKQNNPDGVMLRFPAELGLGHERDGCQNA